MPSVKVSIQRVAEGDACRQVVVGPAEQPAVVDGRRPASCSRHHVVEFHPNRGVAGAAPVERPLALAAVPLPDGAAHGDGDVIRTGRPRIALRLRPATPSLHLLLQQQVQRRLEDLSCSRARLSMGLPGPRAVELGHEPLRDGEMQPAQLDRQGLARHRTVVVARQRGGSSQLRLDEAPPPSATPSPPRAAGSPPPAGSPPRSRGPPASTGGRSEGGPPCGSPR